MKWGQLGQAYSTDVPPEKSKKKADELTYLSRNHCLNLNYEFNNSDSFRSVFFGHFFGLFVGANMHLPEGLWCVPENGLAPAKKRVERQVGLPADEVGRRLTDDAVGEQRRHLHRQRRADAENKVGKVWKLKTHFGINHSCYAKSEKNAKKMYVFLIIYI